MVLLYEFKKLRFNTKLMFQSYVYIFYRKYDLQKNVKTKFNIFPDIYWVSNMMARLNGHFKVL